MIVWNLWEWVVNLMGIGIALLASAIALLFFTLVLYVWWCGIKAFTDWVIIQWMNA
tara:strand:- start:4706 stop:4873 length:168 start_codon:yes stop_codon:yes gene_type:complete